MRTRKCWGLVAGAALLSLVGGLGRAQAADLRLIQQFEIRQGSTTLLQEQREIFLQGSGVILRNPTHHFLIRSDLQRAWLLTAERQLVSEVPIEQLRRDLSAKELGPVPGMQTTTEMRNIQGLDCQVYRTAAARITAEACVTRQLPALEKFRDLAGAKPEVPGIPLSFQIQIAGPEASTRYSVQQRLLKIDTSRLDPRLFAPPAEPATTLKKPSS